MVPLKTHEILACLEAIDSVRRADTQLHLLGITRSEHLARFMKYGVTSFDSTSPFRQAFKDERDNYYTRDKTYTAIRVPQVQGNIRLRAQILAGRVEQATALRMESACRKALSQFDLGLVSAELVLELLTDYDALLGMPTSRHGAYGELLKDQPWKRCSCEICKSIGIEVIVFRGSERNKRRGFHNLHIFWERLKVQVAEAKGENTLQLRQSLALESVR